MRDLHAFAFDGSPEDRGAYSRALVESFRARWPRADEIDLPDVSEVETYYDRQVHPRAAVQAILAERDPV